MSLQETNLVDRARWVGLDNFRPCSTTRCSGRRSRTRCGSRSSPSCSATRCRCPRRADERGGAGAGVYRLAYLPVVIPPVAAILLWKVFYDASPTGVFNTILGWVGLGP